VKVGFFYITAIAKEIQIRQRLEYGSPVQMLCEINVPFKIVVKNDMVNITINVLDSFYFIWEKVTVSTSEHKKKPMFLNGFLFSGKKLIIYQICSIM